MRKIWTVAMREYRTNVKTKSFLIAVFVVPLLMFGSMGVAILMKSKGETGAQRLAVLDYSGALFGPLQARAIQRNEELPTDPDTGEKRGATFELSLIAPDTENRDAQLFKLSDQVRDGTYFAFVEISADILDGDGAEDDPTCGFGFRYYTNQQTRRDLPRWLDYGINGLVKEMRLNKLVDANKREDAKRALWNVEDHDLDLLTRSESGEIQQARQSNKLSSIMMPFGLMMCMFMGLMITTQSLLHGVLEEKMQRIAEVLLGSIPPLQLMMGKLVGLMLVVFTLLGIYFSVGYVIAYRMGQTNLIEPRLIAWFFAFLIPGIFMYGALFLAVGSCCNDIKETQSLVMPIMFPMMLPMFLMMPAIMSPNGTLITIVSLVPIWTPMMMIMRLALPVVVPWWQPPLAMAGCLATMVLAVWAAGRIFRIGFLMQGKAPKIRDLLRWAVRG
ncbi:MAG: ABC transporter permease [Phycisphaerae bacterium]